MKSTASATKEGATDSASTSAGGGSSKFNVERTLSGNSERSKEECGVSEDRSDKGIGSSDVDVELQLEEEDRIQEKKKLQLEEEDQKKKFHLEFTKDEYQEFGFLRPRLSQVKRQWSIQAVKGKVTTRCLWNACKALTIGIVLIFIGAGMATVGYYAEEANLREQRNITEMRNQQLRATPAPPQQGSNNHSSNYWRPPQIVGSNVPRRNPRPSLPSHDPVLNSSTSFFSFGLTKLSYVGPIVMGVGGFVIVAACVMTFEARDSAAKIVPARYRSFPEHSFSRQEDPGVRHSGVQTKWETLEVYGAELMRFHHEKELSRRAMTSAFIRFSKTIQSSMDSSAEYYEFRGGHRGNLVKCPSAPSLIQEFQQVEKHSIEAPRILMVSAFPHPHSRRRLSSNAYPRQTMSVDNPAIKEAYVYPAFIGEKGDEDLELGASATGVHRVPSDESLALDLHLPRCAVTLSVRDSSRSPSGQATDQSEPSIATPLLETRSNVPLEEIAGPSGVQMSNTARSKVDKQTSTLDHNDLAMLGWSKDASSIEYNESGGGFKCSRATSGGSFRELRRTKANKKVKRSETIDTTSSAHKKHRKSQRSRTGSIKNSNNDVQKMTSIRSETARKHQLLRQPKFEATEVRCDSEKGAHVV